MRSKLLLELVFWLISFLLIALLLLPIYTKVYDYQFYGLNIITTLIAFHFIRSIFLLKHMWFSHHTKVKVVCFFLCIPVLLYLIDAIYNFQSFRDNTGVTSLVGHLPLEDQLGISTYIIRMTMISWISAVIATVVFPIRLLKSVWLLRNRGTV